ncbi:unnamed protein product [Eruca vesicaria subsp. sativa]|uniref:MADS-box domain-containing protein n=1 Tax=Eruca vesicaria subsp. sativa TaxID=29727 RepID=A0ABC8J443_ERUVS|nr:unnamed protein product [Eruca vesicaria subsp. sativa]
MNNTKGKRRTEMKKVEDYKARLATFSKRKAGIIKKMNEIVAQCDVEASFLVFSEAGRAHSFAHPSMEDAIARVKNPLRHEPSGENGTNIEQLVEAHKRQKNEMLKEMYAALAEELEMEEQNEKILKGLLESGNDESDKKWWEDDEGLSVEELKRKHEAFVELNVNLCAASQQFGKDRSV